MRRIALLAVLAGALAVPVSAGASGGLSAGGIAACAAAINAPVGGLAPVTSLSSFSPPGPVGGPNSYITYNQGKNNGTDLIAYCQTKIG